MGAEEHLWARCPPGLVPRAGCRRMRGCCRWPPAQQGHRAVQDVRCFLSTIISGSSVLKKGVILYSLSIAQSLAGCGGDIKPVWSQVRAGETRRYRGYLPPTGAAQLGSRLRAEQGGTDCRGTPISGSVGVRVLPLSKRQREAPSVRAGLGSPRGAHPSPPEPGTAARGELTQQRASLRAALAPTSDVMHLYSS